MITAKSDSVGGQRCLIVYQDDKPILSIWEVPGGTAYANRTWADVSYLAELDKLLDTMRLFHMPYEDIVKAVQTFINEKEH